MKDYKEKLKAFYKIIDQYRGARRVILDNEAHQETIQLKIGKLTDEARKKLKTLIDDLAMEVNIYDNKMNEEFIKSIREGNDQARAGYVQVNTATAFDGLTSEEIIEKYPDYIAGLHPDDKPYKWVVEDYVKNKIKDKADTEIVKNLFEQTRTAKQKVAAAQLDSVQALKDSHLTMVGAMESHFNTIAEGRKPQDLSVVETFDSLVEGHGKYKPPQE